MTIRTTLQSVIPPKERKACSFERIYFSRGNDAEIYQERKKLGELLFPKVEEAVKGDFEKTVFSYIPNTAETAFYGLVESVQKQMKNKAISALRSSTKVDEKTAQKLLNSTPRTEKVILKDVKLRTFITEDSSRDDLVAHVYDITYKTVSADDNLVILDDSIVRGTTLKKSILKILDRLNPKKIIVVSSAPQIRYPDCYGIDMARLEKLIAFQAMLALLKDTDQEERLARVYEAAKKELQKPSDQIQNVVSSLYDLFTTQEISKKVGQLLRTDDIQAEVEIIFQEVDQLHKACPKTSSRKD